MNDVLIDPEILEPKESHLRFPLPDGGNVTVGKYYVDFLFKLQSLPAPTRILMMDLSEEDLLLAIEKKHKENNQKILHLLSQNWFWRETGEKMEFSPEFISNVNLSLQKIHKRCKSCKKTFSFIQEESIINFFIGSNSCVYSQ